MKLTTPAFLSKWLALFQDNTNREITEAYMRDFRQDISDSFVNIETDSITGVRGVSPGISTIADLKLTVTASLPTTYHPILIFRDSVNGNVLRVYELVAGTDAESSPTVIRPNDYDGTSNQKIWKLSMLNIDGGTV